MDGACATRRGVAADVGAREAQLIAKEVHEKRARFDVAGPFDAIDRHRDLHVPPRCEPAGSAPANGLQTSRAMGTTPLRGCLTVRVSIPQQQVAVVLAAGSSSRFEAGAKQFAIVEGSTLVAIAAQAALDAECFVSVIVVAGAVSLDGMVPEGVSIVENPAWASGQASSLQVALRAAQGAGAEAVVVGLADQPGVTAEAWRQISQAVTDQPIVVATYDGVRGNPVRLNAEIWAELPQEGDEGARVLLRRRPDLVAAVACEGDASDVDTVEDLDRWN